MLSSASHSSQPASQSVTQSIVVVFSSVVIYGQVIVIVEFIFLFLGGLVPLIVFTPVFIYRSPIILTKMTCSAHSQD